MGKSKVADEKRPAERDTITPRAKNRGGSGAERADSGGTQ